MAKALRGVLSQRFQDPALEALFWEGRERSSNGLVLYSTLFSVALSPIRLWYLFAASPDSGWPLWRVSWAVVGHSAAFLLGLLVYLQKRWHFHGERWEWTISLVLFTTVTATMAQYHPFMAGCVEEENPDCQDLAPIVLVCGMLQVATFLVIVSRSGIMWLVTMLPALAFGVWGLADCLLPIFTQLGKRSGGEAVLCLTWAGPALALQLLGWGYIQEREARQTFLELHWPQGPTPRPKDRAKGDPRFAEGMVRLAMARFEVVLGLRADLHITSAPSQADELLGTQALGADFLSFLEESDALELQGRLQRLLSEHYSHSHGHLEDVENSSIQNLITTAVCKLRFGEGTLIRVMATALPAIETSKATGKELTFLIAIERAGSELPALRVVRDSASQDEVSRRLSGGRRARRSRLNFRSPPSCRSPHPGTPARSSGEKLSVIRGEAPSDADSRGEGIVDVDEHGASPTTVSPPTQETETMELSSNCSSRLSSTNSSMPDHAPEGRGSLAMLKGIWDAEQGSAVQILVEGDSVCLIDLVSGRQRFPEGILWMSSQDALVWWSPATPNGVSFRRVQAEAADDYAVVYLNELHKAARAEAPSCAASHRFSI